MHNSTAPVFDWEEIFNASLEGALSAIPLDVPQPLKEDGKYHHFNTKENSTNPSGFYSFDGRVLRVGDWRTGQAWKWRNGAGADTEDTEEADQEQREEFERQAQEHQAEQQENMLRLWESAEECRSHPYLENKKLAPVGLRVYQNLLLVPGFNKHGTLKALQKITASGHKRHLAGSQPKGAFFPLRREGSEVLYLTESVANALSIYWSTERSDVWSTFGTSNLASVAFKARDLDLPVVVVADADPHGKGEEAAEAATAICLAKLAVPWFGDDRLPNGDLPTDVADTWLLQGPEGVREVLATAEYPPKVLIRQLIEIEKSLPYKFPDAKKKLIERMEWGKQFVKDRMRDERKEMAAEDSQARIEEIQERARYAGSDLDMDAPIECPYLGGKDSCMLVYRAFKGLGYGGNRRQPMLVYLCCTTRLLIFGFGNMLAHLVLVGPASSGKNYQADTVLVLIPEDAVVKIDAGSPKALIYLDADLQHAVAVFTEVDSLPITGGPTSLADGDSRSTAASAIRNLASDGYLSYDVVERDTDGQFYTRHIRKPGPTLLLTTSTKPIVGQLGTRLWHVPVKDTDEQIRKALTKQAELEMTRLRTSADQLVQYQRYLQSKGPWDVLVPFADVLADLLQYEGMDPRIMRDFQRILSLIKAVTILRHQKRQQDEKGRWIADLADYGFVRCVLNETYSATVNTGLTEDVRTVVRAVKALRTEGALNVTYETIAKKLRWHISKAHRKAGIALRSEWLVNRQEKKRQPADLHPGAEMPESRGLPTVNDIRHAISLRNQCKRANAYGQAVSTFAPPLQTRANGANANDSAANEEGAPPEPRETVCTPDTDPIAAFADVCNPPANVETASRLAFARLQQIWRDIGEYTHTVVTEERELPGLLPEILSSEIIAVDLETTGLDPLRNWISVVSLAVPGKTLVVDTNGVRMAALREVFDGTHTLIFHNAKFDLKFLGKTGLWLKDGKRLFDTQLASQLLSAGITEPLLCPWDPKDKRNKGKRRPGPHALVEVAKRYLDVDLDKSLQTSDWSAPELSKEQLTYAGMDAYVLLALRERLADKLKEAGLKIAAEIEFRSIPAFVWMELSGMPIDREGWEALARSNEAAAEAAKAELDALAPGVNWNSPKQISELFSSRGYEIYSTAIEVIKELADKEPIAAALVKYREAAKRAGTYGMDWAKEHIHPVTGRVHADFLQHGSVAGRSSCKNPNLQNIPRDSGFRELFKAPEGMSIVKLDYSQIELRIMAVLSSDETMLEAYRKGEDIHRKTAAAIAGVAEEAVTKAQRQMAKAINFGLIYGMGAATLVKTAKRDYGVIMSEEEASRYREKFFETYPGIRRWHRSLPNEATETRTLMGRRRLAVSKFTEKCNTPDQGTGADGLKIALGRIYEQRDRLHGAVIINGVHDEILLQSPDEHVEEIAEVVREIMIEAMGFVVSKRVPIEVDVAIQGSW